MTNECDAPMRRIRIAAVLAVLLCATGVPAMGQTAEMGAVALTEGWATFGQVVPKGIAVGGLQVGDLQTQTDVKNRWPDKSIRFAIVSVLVPAAAAYPVTAGSASSGSFTPAASDASVTFTIAGASYTATLPAPGADDRWLDGPLAHEARSVVAPASPVNGAAHPFLRVNFDRRTYNDGTMRLDVSVENVLDKTGATTVTYDVTIRANGQTLFTKTAVQHYYLTRWRKVFAVGGTALSTPTPDLTPFNRSNALPPYLPLVTNVVSAPTGTNYEILKQGALNPNMPAHGGRPELAPFPDWTARYLVHRNATQRAFVLANGDLSGSWPIHVREAEGSVKPGVGAERYVSLDQRPTIWYDSRAQSNGSDYIKGSPLPIREYGSLTPGPGQSALIPDTAHQPSLAYVPYLLTGDRYYAEEMAFWGNYSMLRTYNGDGVRGANGILAYNEVRGYGWALRNIVDAAAYYPDASPMRAYLGQKLASNLQWLDDYANRQDPAANPFRVLWLNKRPEGSHYIGLWEQNYLAFALDRSVKQGFVGGVAHRDAIARLQLKLFTSDPAYARSDAAPYLVGVGTAATGGFNFYKSMGEIWTATRAQHRDFAGYYGPEARLNLMIGVEAGWAGAQGAYDYLWPFIAVEPFWSGVPDLGQRAGWALDFSAADTPSPPGLSLSDIRVSSITQTEATITWSTNVASSSQVDFGTTSAYGRSVSDPSTVTAHELRVSGLAASTTYRFRVTSRTAGDEVISPDQGFVTVSEPPPPPPPPPPPQGITVDSVVFSDGTGTRTTSAFSTSAPGAVLIALVAADGPLSNPQSATVTGGGLAWSLVRRANSQAGVAEIWTATAASQLSQATVRSTLRRTGYHQSLTVVAFAGAGGIGASARASARTGAPRLQLTTTAAGSLVFGVGHDWDRAVARTLGSGQTMVHQWVDTSVNDTFWVQRLTDPVAAAGTSVLVNVTAPVTDRWNLAAVEIRR
jgi:hypothetical protein